MRKAWKTALCGAALGIALTSACASAGAPNVKRIDYQFHQNNIFNQSYDLARKAMADIYNGTDYEPRPDLPPINPLIGIGEIDLNGDDIPEIISFPTEEEFEEGKFCKPNIVCPFYVFQVENKKIRMLGKVFASSIDRGDNITNGYWDLKIYTNDWTEPKADEFDLYAYDKKSRGYVKVSTAANVFKQKP